MPTCERHPDVEIIDNCYRCGAPQCCPECCRETTEELMATPRQEKEYEGFCTHCSVKIESFEGITKCPSCGTNGTPCSYANQLTVSINHQELRIICIWAENWANAHKTQDDRMPEVVYAIAGRLRKQLPESKQCLTLNDEFRQLKERHPNFKTNHPAADDPEIGESYKP